MGIGEDYYPLPWSLLTYNPRLDGYEINITEQQLKGAPKFSQHENWVPSGFCPGVFFWNWSGLLRGHVLTLSASLVV
jgi:hypothetical protein